MGASRLEYRFRFALHALIFTLGFWAPWCVALGWTRTTTWLVIASTLSKAGWLSFVAATNAVLVVATVLVALGAWLRIWGAAYVGASIVQSREMHGATLLADGPYRRIRNPLYLGTILHVLGLAILMPPSGAIFCVVMIWVLQVRLALAEEPFLESKFGDAYRAFRARVPRFLPAPTPRVTSAGAAPRWGQAVLGEIYMLGVVVTYLVLGWSFNAMTLTRGVLISLGLWFIVKAMLPRPARDGSAAA